MNARNSVERIMTKKLWISAVGFVLAIGYVMNCIVEPLNNGAVRLISWDELNRALLILLVISGTRDITLNGLKLLGGRLSIKNAQECTNPDCQPFRKAVKRYWIPVVGWALVGGFVMNCIVWPLVPTVTVVSWDELTTALLIVLIISGGRDITLSGVKLLGGKISIKTPKCTHQNCQLKKKAENKTSADKNPDKENNRQ